MRDRPRPPATPHPLDHPAARAWVELHGPASAPDAVDVLAETGKTGAYRLHGVGPGRADVIGKQGCARRLELERLVYQEVLPLLPLRSLHCYGFVETGATAWLFLEDADRDPVRPLSGPEQRIALAGWLGTLHAAAAGVPTGPRLPARGPAHYLEHLRASRSLIRRHLPHPRLDEEDRRSAGRLLGTLDALEARWPSLERLCRDGPLAVVHGDLAPKNLRMRDQGGTAVVLPFDWETAGWGVPAADLFLLAEHPDEAAMEAYVSSVGPAWPRVSADRVRELARVGHVFRLLACVWWAASELDQPWIERPRWKLRQYEHDLQEAVAVLARGSGAGPPAARSTA